MRVRSRKQSSLVLGLGIALVLIGGMVGAAKAYAADPLEEITISPTDKHYELNPGETVSDSFTILNSGQSEYDFITYGSPYSVNDGNYNAVYDINAPRSDAFRWVQMDTTQWHATVRQTITVPFTIRVPANATPGGHYGVLFAETKPADDASGIVRKKRIGMILYVKVKGDVVNRGAVKDISTNWFYSHAPITATVSVEDSGNTDFIAKTKMTVTDLFGNVKYVMPQEYNILPGTHRDIPINYETPPWFGLFKVKVEATAIDGGMVHESYVLVAPYWLILVLGIALILGAIDVVRRKKSKGTRHSGH